MKLALVCSNGGHLFQLYSLKSFWGEFEHFWVTSPAEDAQFLLSAEKTYSAHYPTNRNLPNLIKNLFLAMKVLKREKPDVIISTGAGVGVAFICIGFLMGIKSIYIESVTRVRSLSLTAKLVYPIIDSLLVQWPELAQKYHKARYVGRCL